MKSKTILKITPKGRPNAGTATKGEAKKKADQKAASKVTPAKAKRTSALDAAAIVLKKASKPMRSQELITAMAEQKLWTSPGGKTPHATLYAAILREINEKGKEARFKKVDRGQFEFIG
ncbi:MAG: winged helix-turn-helix domain-containing protein [Planctomycetes bacterium]|nr:winged helix-turn-helix domain-containing protein [Planctomycetota bacterium]